MTDHNDSKSEVLFQKLGNTWYAFSEVQGEIIFSALPNGIDPTSQTMEFFEVIEDHMQKVAEKGPDFRPPLGQAA